MNRITRLQFLNSFNSIAAKIHETAIMKGWWDQKTAEDWMQEIAGNGKIYSLIEAFEAGQANPERNKGEMISLMHSELTECLEALRAGNPKDDKIPGHSGMAAELADTIIRIMDFDIAFGIGVANALIAKIEYNETRPYKHGGKKF